jgi:hypothetical protein
MQDDVVACRNLKRSRLANRQRSREDEGPTAASDGSHAKVRDLDPVPAVIDQPKRERHFQRTVEDASFHDKTSMTILVCQPFSHIRTCAVTAMVATTAATVTFAIADHDGPCTQHPTWRGRTPEGEVPGCVHSTVRVVGAACRRRTPTQGSRLP